MSGADWREIESAPTDRTRVLAFVPPYGAMTAHFSPDMGQWVCHGALNKEAQPTHWMPLPDPPTRAHRGTP